MVDFEGHMESCHLQIEVSRGDFFYLLEANYLIHARGLNLGSRLRQHWKRTPSL